MLTLDITYLIILQLSLLISFLPITKFLQKIDTQEHRTRQAFCCSDNRYQGNKLAKSETIVFIIWHGSEITIRRKTDQQI